MSKGPLFRYGSAILLVFVLLRILWWLFPNVCTIWDLQVEDQVARFVHERGKSPAAGPDIVHIDLDDRSIAALEDDPNDPRLYAELVRILRAAGVRTILIDMLFPYCRSEPDCLAFADAVKTGGNVYLPLILSNSSGQEDGQRSQTIRGNWLFPEIPGIEHLRLLSGRLSMANIAPLNISAAGLGHINFPPDRDGVYRHLPLLIESDGGISPSIALRALCGYLEIDGDQLRLQQPDRILLKDARFPDGRTRDIAIPVDRRGRNRINFSGSWNDSFAHYGFAAILQTGATSEGLQELTDELEGTIAIVSDVSTGSRDFGPIPLSTYFPLSGLHSNFINSVLEDDFLSTARPWQSLALDGVLTALLALGACLRGWRFFLGASLLLALTLFASVSLFTEERILLPMVRPSLSLLLAVASILLLQFFEIQQKEQYIRGRLTHYFAPSLMDKILREPELLNTVEKKELTILFSDIAGFTSWSSTRDAAEIHRTLNRYFEEMAKIVFAHQGTIDKYMGDGLLVFFGDPIPCENHALAAVRTAIAMQQRVRELRAEWEGRGGMPIVIRIGIHTGDVVVGNMGSQSRMEYTVIGSNVNLAQRLESNCPPGGVLVSEAVRSRLTGDIPVEPVGTVQAKGFAEPIPVHLVRTNEQTPLPSKET
ncbi:MAG: adenylate/guanylate cyclase domain-containing protein [Desulfobulbaceae bacterium]